MTRLTKLTAFALALGLGLTPVVTAAQDASTLSEEELRAKFNKQKTRGLVIAPSGGQPSTTTSQNTNVETTTTTTAAVKTNTTTYVEVDREEQINVQISFDFDSAALREDQKPKLVTLCRVVNSIDVQVFQIVGHTDSSGSASYNERLSKLRAEEVMRYMVNDCGVDPSRLEAVGAGENFPFNSQNPRADENRRVEFQALG